MRHPVYLEDFLLALNRLSLFIPPADHKNYIKLGTQDKPVVRSFASQIEKGQGLTMKQIELIKILVAKYKRSLIAFNIDSMLAISAPLKYPIRKVEYIKKIYVEGTWIILKFPFNVDLIRKLQEFAKNSHGAFFWNNKFKRWEIAYTEYNVFLIFNIMVDFEGFEIDEELLEYYEKILEIKNQPYRIEMQIDGIIKNGSPYLQEAMDKVLKEYDDEFLKDQKILIMVALANTYKYTLSYEILQRFNEIEKAIKYVS